MTSRLVALLTFIWIWAPQAVHAADTCSALFVPSVELRYSHARVKHLQRVIKQKFGIKISSDTKSLSDLGAGYHPQEGRVMLIDSSDSSLVQILNMLHETVHAKTDYLIRYNSRNPQRVMGITFRSEGVLHKALSVEYQNFFSIDETKAYSKQTQVLKQIRREHPGAVKGIEDAISASEVDRDAFKTASRELMNRVRLFLNESAESDLRKSIKVASYAEDARGVFMMIVTLPATETAPAFSAAFPIKDYTVSNESFGIGALRNKMTVMCDMALRLLP